MSTTKRAFIGALLAGASMLATTQLSIAGQPVVNGTDLSLYGIGLKDASVRSFVTAAESAGARAVKPTADITSAFDATGAGIPALTSFVVISDGEDLVAVQFDVKESGTDGETFRKMLATKYGAPARLADGFGRGEKFTDEFLQDGEYSWQFKGNMRLVYKRDFFGATTLTYVDRVKFKRLMDRAAATSNKSAAAKAGAQSSKF